MASLSASLSNRALAAIVGRLALAIALVVALTIPGGYAIITYQGIVGHLVFLAGVKSDAISRGLIDRNPQFWPYQVLRMEDVLSAEPRAAADQAFAAFDAAEKLIWKAGTSPDPPVVRRSHPLYERGRIVGRVEVEQSMRGWAYGTGLAALLGLALAAGVYATLRVLPMRALRRLTDALEANSSRLLEALQAQETGIAARAKIESELRHSEESYRKLFELSPDGMFICRDGKVVMVNAVCMRMFRATTAEQIVGRQVEDLFHADHRARVAEQLRRVDGESCALPPEEQEIVTSDGVGTPVEVSTAAYLHAGERGVQVVLRDITERKKADERLNYLAQYDALTGLPNRALFQDRLAQGLEHAKRSGRSAAVLFMDLDRFKAVNDTLGHAAGDKLLKKAAARLKDCVRAGDTVGRFGGDEFGIMLLTLAEPAHAGLVAQKVIDAIAHPFDLDGHRTFIAASVGITLYPADGTDSATLNKNADAAMYRAKESGGSAYQFFTKEMNERAIRRARTEAAMRLALERGEFVLHYQPRVDIASGEICGVEALLRWAQPEGGLVAPADFISVLEDSGLIVPAGEWVILEACRQIVAWSRLGLQVPHVAVNLSARQFRQKNLEEKVADILRMTGAKPAQLQFEITESLLMDDSDAAARTLRNLRGAGIKLSIDDFGTGYSSLAYLRGFPLDALKIDRAFIKDIVTNPDDAAITLAIINLGHSLGLRVVAEGVESEAQLNLLALHACDELQGYYFSKPLPPLELEDMLRAGRRLARSHDASVVKPAVLLLDYDDDELALLKRTLRGEAFEVLTAASAEQAFALLANHPVCVVISDQRMPGMTGTEFLEKLRRLYPNALRVAITGANDPDGIAAALAEAGAHKLLLKTWDSERLRREIRKAYQRATGQHIRN